MTIVAKVQTKYNWKKMLSTHMQTQKSDVPVKTNLTTTLAKNHPPNRKNKQTNEIYDLVTPLPQMAKLSTHNKSPSLQESRPEYLSSQVNTYDSKKYFVSSNEEQLERGLRGELVVCLS